MAWISWLKQCHAYLHSHFFKFSYSVSPPLLGGRRVGSHAQERVPLFSHTLSKMKYTHTVLSFSSFPDWICVKSSRSPINRPTLKSHLSSGLHSNLLCKMSSSCMVFAPAPSWWQLSKIRELSPEAFQVLLPETMSLLLAGFEEWSQMWANPMSSKLSIPVNCLRACFSF